MIKSFRKNKITFIFAFIFILLRPLVVIFVPNFLHLMLGFNIFLAMIPLYLSTLLLIKYKKSLNIWLIIIFICWFFFIPNSWYLITDLIHIQNIEFYNSNFNIVYFQNVKAYIALIDIILAIVIGLVLAVKSLLQIHRIYIYKFKKAISSIILFITILFSSIGIYIGRFLRFNSWDILRPIQLIKSLYQSLNIFSLFFILLFTFGNLFIYLLYYFNQPVGVIKEIDSYIYEDLGILKEKK